MGELTFQNHLINKFCEMRLTAFRRAGDLDEAFPETSLSSSLLSSLELSGTKIYEPYIRDLLGTAPHFCQVVVLELLWAAGANRGAARPGEARCREARDLHRSSQDTLGGLRDMGYISTAKSFLVL